jgi:hypothetical protein
MVLELIMLSETNQTQKENVFFHVRNQSIYQSINLSIYLLSFLFLVVLEIGPRASCILNH